LRVWVVDNEKPAHHHDRQLEDVQDSDFSRSFDEESNSSKGQPANDVYRQNNQNDNLDSRRTLEDVKEGDQAEEHVYQDDDNYKELEGVRVDDMFE
jgi:plasmid replication initiation protein